MGRDILRKKMFFYVFTSVLVLFISMGVITYIKVFDLIESQSKTHGQSVAFSAASDIDGDVFEAITSVDCPEYTIVYDALSHYKVLDNVNYIYAFVTDSTKSSLYFLVDTDTETPAGFMEPYEIFDDILPAFEGKICSDQTTTSDKWGEFLSSYAPICNSKGEVVGVVGVDTYIDYLQSSRDDLIKIIVTVVAIFGILGFYLYLHITNDFLGMDSLTSLYNQDYMEELAKKKYENNDQLKLYSAVMLNILDFRLINTSYGYVVGDKVLLHLARHIKSIIKDNGIAARSSSDNFIILVKNRYLDFFLESLSDIVYTHTLPDSSKKQIPIPVYCGVYQIREFDTVDDVINRVVIALRDSKKTASPSIVFYTNEMYDNAVYERKILADFTPAIENNEFKVYFQPKINIKENKLCGAEALVRWIKDGQLVSPGSFIPVYEREGLITELDFFVYEKVCEAIKNWTDQGYELIPISSNFSKIHLIQEDFADRIINIADKYGVDHKYLDIELTESSGHSNKEELDIFIQKIRESGIHISMDDFGSGYSSFELLDSSLFDTIKIDKTLTDKILKNEDGKTFIKNIIKTVTETGCHVVCEGVEIAAQIVFLREETNCEVVQGYFYDKPLPMKDFEVRLKAPFY